MTTSVSIPDTMRALVLSGRGFEHLAVRRVPTPHPGPRQLLVRVDAAGICTSLIKLIEQGGDHSLLYDWDLARYPLILGDEGSVTVMVVGEELRDRYHPGERYVVQPAVDHSPLNHRERYRDGGAGVFKLGVGYTLPGHLAEYLLITEEILEAGCLLPLPSDDIAYAHAAMSEPFSCAVSAQEHHLHLVQANPLEPRTPIKGLKPGGVTLVVGAGAMGRMHVDLALASGPRSIVVTDVLAARLERTRTLFEQRADELGVALYTLNPTEREVKSFLDDLTGYRGADDVIVAVGATAAVEEAQLWVARGGVLDLFGGFKRGGEVLSLDGNIVHYRETVVTGSSGGSPWDVARTLELMAAAAVDMSGHITRIGDLEHATEFLAMVKRRELDGKAVIYPHWRKEDILVVDAWTLEDERVYLGDG